VRLSGEVKPADAGASGVGLQQCGEDPNGGGLARAVGAEDAKDGARRYGEVDPVEGLRADEALAQTFGVDHEV
jgi:hypothetical protein